MQFEQYDRKIVLEDGTEFYGRGFGSECERVCELVFNTAMLGYQEIISDPAYTYQAVVMTYPIIGNYGTCDDDFESKVPTIGGLVVREYNDVPSNFRTTKTLNEVMEDYNIPGIEGLDTRELTRHIRDNGTCKVLFTSIDTPKEKALEILGATEIPTNAVEVVSCKKRWYSRTANAKYNVVAIDCGIKLSLIRILNSRGCNITIVPFDTSAEEVLKMKPDGIYISDGPGNPEDVPSVIELVRQLKGKCPIFGVGLGHEIIGLAYGAKTYKLKFGHRGCNHSVHSLINNTFRNHTQNHSYVIDAESVEGTELKITHVNLFDKTVEGVSCEKDNVYSVQYVPCEISLFYERFINLMKGDK
ncbi:MAG: glutamine-hydrolyzing carbamoyl-phosphate synthase small subunit [Clostridia bacterium]|nr:glutamine-hydrolyzing carbamoyl-phosphate synthase small subunit [Clostridia bacterium]